METSAEGGLSDLHSNHLKIHLSIKNLTSTHLAKEVMTVTEKKNANGKICALRYAYRKLGWTVIFPKWYLTVWEFPSSNTKP